MPEIEQLEIKYFVLKLKENINAIKLKNLLLTHIADTCSKEISGNDLAVYIVNSIIKKEE